jgi:hypothetical protein
MSTHNPIGTKLLDGTFAYIWFEDNAGHTARELVMVGWSAERGSFWFEIYPSSQWRGSGEDEEAIPTYKEHDGISGVGKLNTRITAYFKRFISLPGPVLAYLRFCQNAEPTHVPKNIPVLLGDDVTW